METVSELIKKFKAPISEAVKNHLMPRFAGMFTIDNPIEAELVDPCCFFIDVFENLDPALAQSCYMDVLAKYIQIWDAHRQDEDRSVLQTTGYGMGVIA